MEAGRARGNRDNPRLPPLSLGLSSFRFIVNKLEAECTRVIASSVTENCRELVKYDPNFDDSCENYEDSHLEQSRGRVWHRFVVNLGVALSKCIPSVTFANFGFLAVVTGLLAPRMISYLVIYPLCRLVFGTLYPAYASYKAVRTKNLKEYVKWMMYWIVFALFTCTETVTDVFLSWFPFYYEVKIVLVLWLLSPATKGSSILYRKFVHPALCRREQEIDEYIAKAKDQGYHTVLNLGTKGVNYATTVIMQTAIKGGGGLVQQLRKSYSLSDLSECEPMEERAADETDDVLTEPRMIRRAIKIGYRRSASESTSRTPLYFPEVDVEVRATRSRTDEPDFSHIKSTEDISSGYSSADNSAGLTRAGSTGAGRTRGRPTRASLTTVKRPPAAEDNQLIIEEQHDDDTFEYSNMPPLVNMSSSLFLSHTNPPFIYQCIGNEVKIIQVLGDYLENFNKQLNNSKQDHQNETSLKKNIIESGKEILNNTLVDAKRNMDDPSVFSAQLETEFINNKSIDVNTEEKASSCKISDNKNDFKPEDVITENLDTSNDLNIHYEIKNDNSESTNIDKSINSDTSTESDDEASFGTPNDSPKYKRKNSKGKYGKGKAPPPPINDKSNIIDNTQTIDEDGCNNDDSDIQKAFKDNMDFKSDVVNPIAENKRRHKSKSPGNISKGSSSGLGKLLQLPGKLSFWNRDDKSKVDTVSTSSEDQSSISSTIDNMVDEFQSCTDLRTLILNTNNNNLESSENSKNEVMSQDIINKSDVLQKLIEAKLESHPEYKLITHEEISTTSKSTDV